MVAKREFYDADALIEALCADTKDARFPVTFVEVSGLSTWIRLLQKLRPRCPTVVLSSLCLDEDSFPFLGNLLPKLKELNSGLALLLPLGEALRLAPNPGYVPIRELAEWQAPGRRLIAPVLDAEELLEEHLVGLHRYESGECEVWTLARQDEDTITLKAFATCPPIYSGETIRGLKAYFQLWESAGQDDIVLETSWACSLPSRIGGFAVHPYASAFSVVKDMVHGVGELDSAWGSEAQWQSLIQHLRESESLGRLSGRLLQVRDDDPKAGLERWMSLNSDQRWLAWLWAKADPATLLPFEKLLISQSETPLDLLDKAAMLGLSPECSGDMLQDRREALLYLGGGAMPQCFWDKFSMTNDNLVRLGALPGVGQRDRETIVLEVAGLIRSGAERERWLLILRSTFPELAHLLEHTFPSDHFLSAYLPVYVEARILDKNTQALAEATKQWVAGQALWNYPTRSEVLSSEAYDDIVWVDALGIVWGGLLVALLDAPGVSVEGQVARAQLPTITGLNKEWESDDQIDRQLDRIAHDPEYNYPGSLVRQLEWIAQLAQRVSSHAASSVVVITGDHGTTRFARGTKVDPPPHCVVGEGGRYATCDRGEALLHEMPGLIAIDNYVVLADHRLFSGGRTAPGEAHGGATPEEALVPVIRVRPRPSQEIRILECDKTVSLDVQGRGSLAVRLEGAISEATLVCSQRRIQGQHAGGTRWEFQIEIPVGMISSGRVMATVFSASAHVGTVEFVIQRGIEEKDLGI